MARKAFSIALVLVIGVLGAIQLQARAQAESTTGTVEQSLEIGGRERTYRVHVPKLEPPSAGFPVVIVLHGGGGNGKQVERSTGFSELADSERFVAVYPDGTGRLPRRLTWNAFDCCGFAHAEEIDDVAFISALIDRVVADFAVDPSRVYVTGHSNGAMLTFRLACELADQLAAAAPYAGALNSDSCDPASPVPILIMNGEDDQNVPMAGGLSPNIGVGSEDDRVDSPTAHAVETWVGANGCTGVPAESDEAAAAITRWSDCASGSVVEQVVIHGWEHGWPREADDAPLDGAQTIWSFVSAFSKPGANLAT